MLFGHSKRTTHGASRSMTIMVVGASLAVPWDWSSHSILWAIQGKFSFPLLKPTSIDAESICIDSVNGFLSSYEHWDVRQTGPMHSIFDLMTMGLLFCRKLSCIPFIRTELASSIFWTTLRNSLFVHTISDSEFYWHCGIGAWWLEATINQREKGCLFIAEWHCMMIQVCFNKMWLGGNSLMK